MSKDHEKHLTFKEMYRYVNGRYDAEKNRTVDLHTKHCPSCAEKIAHLKQIKYALDKISPLAYIEAKTAWESTSSSYWKKRVSTAIRQIVSKRKNNISKYLSGVMESLYDKTIKAVELSVDTACKSIRFRIIHSLSSPTTENLFKENTVRPSLISYIQANQSATPDESIRAEIKRRKEGRCLEVKFKHLPCKDKGPLFALLVPASDKEEPEVVPLKRDGRYGFKADFRVAQSGKYIIFVVNLPDLS